MSNVMRSYYDSYWKRGGAGGYETQGLRNWTGARKRRLLCALHDLIPGSLVLDAGCGIGEFSSFMSEHGLRVVGMDISEIPLYEANSRKLKSTIGYSAASIEGVLPFAADTFSLVWSTEVIEHLIDVPATFREFSRVLVEGGQLIITTPYHGLIKNIVLSLYGYERHYDPVGPHIRFFTRTSLHRVLEQAGFTVEKSYGIGRFWPFWMSHFVIARKVRS